MTSVYTRQTTAEGALNQNAPLTNEQLDANFINLNNDKANLESPALTGTPTAPTAAVGTDTAQIATTAYVNAEIANDAAPITHVGSGGTAHANVVAAGAAGFMTGADKSKLDGIAAGATANSADAALLDRSNHTGTQAISTVTGLQTALDAKQDVLVSGTNIKTVNGNSLLGSGNVAVGDVTLTGTQTLTNKTITETVFAVTGTTPALTATNGAVQTWTLTAASAPTNALTSGQSVILVITPGAHAITWPSVVWTKQGGSGAAPALFSAGKTSVVLWMVGAVLYGSHLGDTV